MISFLSRTIDFFFFFLSLWIYLWLAETSQQPTSQTTWLKVTPHCNHCNQSGHYNSLTLILVWNVVITFHDVQKVLVPGLSHWSKSISQHIPTFQMGLPIFTALQEKLVRHFVAKVPKNGEMKSTKEW
jgi:hypothetical protein